jgi:hypothetical protein
MEHNTEEGWTQIELPEIVGRIKPTKVADEPTSDTPPPLIIMETRKMDCTVEKKKKDDNIYDIYNLNTIGDNIV